MNTATVSGAGTLRDGARFLRLHLAGRRRALAWLGAYSVLEGLPGFLSGTVVAAALDDGFLAGRPLTGVAWLGVLAVAWLVGAAASRLAYPRLADTVEPMRDSLLTALVSTSLRSAVRGQDAIRGGTVAQATVQVETVRALFSSLLRTTRQLLTAGVAALAGLAVLSPLLALGAATSVLLAGGIFVLLLRVLIVRDRAAVLAGERVTAAAAPVVTGARDVIVAAAEERALSEVGLAIDAEAAAVRSYARARAWRATVVLLGAHVPLLALLMTAPWFVSRGSLTAGEVVGCVVYLSTGLEPAVQLLVNAAGTVVVNLGVVLARLAQACTEDPGPAARPVDGAPPALSAPPVDGARPVATDLAVHELTFRYAPHAEPVVDGLSLHLPAGLHLAVVGPSGVGKSTLADLLAGLAVPERGSVRLGGIPLARIDPMYLRRTMALIPQEAYVFTGTVRENLTYLRPDAADGDVEAAAGAVGLTEVLRTLDGGLDAVIDPGSGVLSPGARQLMALTRVYLSPARLVVLDEATCHLDPVAEARAERAFAERGSTLLVVAHRISSALRAHRVLVMDGAGVDVGTHEELLGRSRLYAELVGHWDGGDSLSSRGRRP